MKISAFLRNYATRFAILPAIVALILFIPASLTVSLGLRIFLIVLIVLLLGGGVALLLWGSRRNGPQVHFFLYDRRRARSRRYQDLDADAVQDAMAYYLLPFAEEPLSLWREIPKPLLLQLEAQPQFRALVTYRMLYTLAEREAEEIYEVFSTASADVVTALCHAIGNVGDNEMADFIYHLKRKRIADRERVVQFFLKNKQRFAVRALRCVERDFDLFYVPKSKFK